MVGEEEFLQYWIHKSGFELVDGELAPMPEWFSDHCLPSGSTFEDLDLMVVKRSNELCFPDYDQQPPGLKVIVILDSPCSIVGVFRNAEFLKQFPHE